MGFVDYLEKSCIALEQRISSKKKVLEHLSVMLCAAHPFLDQDLLFHKLVEREQLSSTAMGKGVAIPHCRINGLEKPAAGLLRLTEGITYDAPDQIAVRLFSVLVVPEDADRHHLNILADIAGKMNDDNLREQLFNAGDVAEILEVLRTSDEAI